MLFYLKSNIPKVSIFLFGLLLVVGVSYFGFIKDLQEKMLSCRKTNRELTTLLNLQQKTIAQLKGLKQKSPIKKRIKISAAKLLHEFTEIGQATGVKLQRVKNLPIVTEDGLYCYPFHVSVVGDFFALNNFLKKLLNGRYFVWVQNFLFVSGNRLELGVRVCGEQ